MADFATHVEDWSLQAIVRESSGEFTKILDSHMDDPDSFFDASGSHNHHLDREFFASFPEIFDFAADSYRDELEGLYKPFYPSTTSLPAQAVLDFQEHAVENDHNQIHGPSSGTAFVARANPAYTPKYKKSRKNQHKRVMVKVSAEGLSTDMWAWRKYGQKPIKGSPYPRSYYRCSSSKGCLARKQVEQSCTDHGMFIITYTAEHNHSQPTRRNSLAGTVRQKFPSVKQEKPDESCTSNSCSPNTPQLQAMDHMNLSQTSMNEEKNYKNDEFVIPDFTVDDDFFSGLQDFDEFVSEPSLYDHNSMPHLSVRSCS